RHAIVQPLRRRSFAAVGPRDKPADDKFGMEHMMPRNRPTLAELEPGANFIRRHIGPDETETQAMLKLVGASSLDDFIDRVIPKQIRAARPLDLPKAKAERSALSYLRQMAGRNEVFTWMTGLHYY